MTRRSRKPQTPAFPAPFQSRGDEVGERAGSSLTADSLLRAGTEGDAGTVNPVVARLAAHNQRFCCRQSHTCTSLEDP